MSDENDRHPLYISFRFAFKGIFEAVKRERNIKIHLSAMSAVIFLGLVLNISRIEWLVLVCLFAMVLSAEIFNSAIESTCDVIRDELGASYESTYWARNFSAGAVLVLALASVISGLLIFADKII